MFVKMGWEGEILWASQRGGQLVGGLWSTLQRHG